MTNIDSTLLDAIRGVVGEAVAPLGVKIDGLTERVDGLTGRVDRVEAEQQLQRRLLYSIQESIDERFAHLDLRLTNLEANSMRLEHGLATIETRTGQISSDVNDLLDLQDKVNKGFQAFKSDFQRAFLDIGALQDSQSGHQRQLKQLRERVSKLEQRLSKLEDPRGTHE